MFRHIFLHLRRTPLQAAGVLLFAAVLAAVLCGLHAANEAEQARYKTVSQTLPVKLTVTNLKGTKSDDLGIPSWMAESFTGTADSMGDLAGYIKDLQRKATWDVSKIGELSGSFRMVGTSAVDLCRELWAENGAAIRWAEGYDASCLAGEARVCLIPADMGAPADPGTVRVYLTEDDVTEFTVAGTVRGGGENTLYCPFLALEAALEEIGAECTLDAMSATLKDNNLLEEFRGVMGLWYIEPDPGGMNVTWPGGRFKTYLYALDINDAQLRAAGETLRSSLAVNRVCTMLVFMLSAGAGFFVGFLMIRQRKREIALMRTLGEADGRVYMSFALEQMVCVLLGTVLGGAYFGWQPADRLGLFVLIYFAGLSAALGVFLRGNLMSAMKEEE